MPEPGTRAAHVLLERDGRSVSALDLFTSRFVVLAGREGAAWTAAARQAGERLGVALDACVIGADLIDPDDQWRHAYGVTHTGVALIRPDGYLGWRCASAVTAPQEAVEQTLRRLLHQEGTTS